MNKSTDINNMIISINNEYRKILECVLSEYENIDGEMVNDILAAWDAKVIEMSDSLVPIVGKAKKSRKATKTGPKRPMSAYLYFCMDKRAEVKEENPTMKATEITSELGRLWHEVKETDEVEQYNELAKADKARYTAEVGEAPKEKKQRKTKASNESDGESDGEKPKKKRAKKAKKDGPKKPKSAYLYFCEEKRGEVKASNPDMKPTEITSELGRLWNKIKETPMANKYREQAEDAKVQYSDAAKVQPEVENSNESGEEEEERKEEAPKKGKKLPKAKEEKVPTTGYQLFCNEEGEGLEKKELRKMWLEMKRSNIEKFQDYEIRAKNNSLESEDEQVAQVDEELEKVILPFLSMNQTQEPEAKAEPPEDDLEEEEDGAEVVMEEEDPALVDTRSLLNYLDEIKSNRPKKDEFLEQVESLENLSSEIKVYIDRVKKLRASIISITAIEKLVVICKDTIKSYEL